ncbi:DUF4846 domain-containing protein [Calditrichota bacterium]
MKYKIIILCLIVNLYSVQLISSNQIRLISDIPVLKDYIRIEIKKNSFAAWLGDLPLKESNSPVLDFRGHIFKTGDDTTVAEVIGWDIRGKRLEQCMDIIVRFYTEYLWGQNQAGKLKLPLPGGYWLDWQSWKQGLRPFFKGIKVNMEATSHPDSTRQNFNKYLQTVFAESGTQQFYFAYKSIKRQQVQIGDFIIKKGVRGHAVLIVDIAVNPEGKMIALIGQGDTPACEFYLLNYNSDNPWFPLNFSKATLPLPIKKKMIWDGLRRFELDK